MAKYLDEKGLSRLVEKTKEYADHSSAAVKTAVDGYTINGKKISTNPVIAKADVGLANVDDVKQIPASEKGKANGVATLGTDSKLTAAQMPAMKTINGESVVGSGNIKIDLSLYKVVTDFPTSNIDATKIYLKLASSTAEKNVYAEYIYTGDTTAAYDASKWEKLGEAQTSIIVDAAFSTSSTNPVQNKVVTAKINTIQDNLTAHTTNNKNPHGVTKVQVGLGNVTNDKQIPWTEKGANNGVAALDGDGHVKDSHLWDASEGFHGLISADDWKRLDDVYGVYDSKTMMVKEGAIPTSAYGVVEFGGMTSGETTMAGSVTRGKIMFNTTKKCFVEVVGSTQYSAIRDGNMFGNLSGGLIKPTAGKIYSMGTSLYMLDAASGDLVLINDRIDETYIETLF
nr:MAG TPA: hypothetical protein [Caudoviricetes sp.]